MVQLGHVQGPLIKPGPTGCRNPFTEIGRILETFTEDYRRGSRGYERCVHARARKIINHKKIVSQGNKSIVRYTFIKFVRSGFGQQGSGVI